MTNFDSLVAPFDGFPWFRSFQSLEGEQIQLEYKSNIGNKHLVFRAEAIKENGERLPVVVKFANTYGTDAHKCCERAECAPRLYHVSTVPRLYCYDIVV